jgi:hypothetical protein
MLASSHQRIAGKTIDATGCDDGIYVGPANSGIQIISNTIRL